MERSRCYDEILAGVFQAGWRYSAEASEINSAFLFIHQVIVQDCRRDFSSADGTDRHSKTTRGSA